MIIRNIKLRNFQCYDNFEMTFSPLTFIKGKNGTGKTTIADAIIFALTGYCRKNLVDLPTKGKAKSCNVVLEVEKDGELYTIDRSYPTKLSILKNGEPLDLATSAEHQRYLSTVFGDANYFKKFRMIDSSVGVNFLEEGQTALKKILFSVSDEVFNKVKDKLGDVKREREIYNKDKAVIYSIYPSDKRLGILKKEIVLLDQKLRTLRAEDQKLSREQYNYSNQKGRIEGQLQTAKTNQLQTMKSTHCYACKQELSDVTKDKMLNDKVNEIATLTASLKDIQGACEELKEIKLEGEKPLELVSKHVSSLNTLKMKLEGRLKQKDYKYSQRDIEIVKQAIRELDNLSTRYLTQTISILEPIINSVLEKINFQVKFEINDKGKFTISLSQDGIVYNYKDLSTGQKLILQIAFKLALLLEKVEEGLIIADEGLSSLDNENLLHVLSIFENFPFQLVFILHGFENIPNGIKIIDLNKIRGEE